MSLEGKQSSQNISAVQEEPGEDAFVPEGAEISPVLTVIMPTLNEEEGITDCIKWIREAVSDLEIPTEVIVSDSSSDSTPEIARENGAIIVTPDKDGYGYAYRYAFEHARGKYIAIGDADATYDFRELPKLFKRITNGDAHMVMGSRLRGEIRPGSMPLLHKYLGNPFLTKFLNTFYGAGVSDAHSGFRVIDRESLERLNLQTDGMEFASEMIMEAGANGMTIEEVPITYHERKGEATLESFQDGWRHVRFMLVNAPGYLFSVPGALLGLFGVLMMIGASAINTIPTIGPTYGLSSMIAGSLLTIVGYQVASLGIFATVAGDPIRKPSDPITTWVVSNLSLERGVTTGCIVFGAGVLYGAYLLIEWIALGPAGIPSAIEALGAFTAIILGLQTIFSAFFMSTIASRY